MIFMTLNCYFRSNCLYHFVFLSKLNNFCLKYFFLKRIFFIYLSFFSIGHYIIILYIYMYMSYDKLFIEDLKCLWINHALSFYNNFSMYEI